MIVLGIADSLTCGAALVADGKVLAAVNEERLNRQKMAMGFPRKSISEVLRIASVEMKDVDHIAVATNSLFWMPEAVKLEDYFRRSRGARSRDLFLASGSLFAKWTNGNQLSREVYHGLKSFLTRARRSSIREVMSKAWGYSGEISFINHHLAHCASAYFTSGMGDATAISLDGAGDGASSHVYHVRDGVFRLLNKIDSYDSIGNYYAYVTHLCGFQAHKHEGKVTGLAAYGKNSYADLLREFIRYEAGKIRNIGGCFDWSAIKKLQEKIGDPFRREDLATSMQTVLEEVVTRYVDHWIRVSGAQNLALAGGVCANVKLNQRIHDLESVDSLFIHPGMGDEGLAAGAALLKSFELCKRAGSRFDRNEIENVYWGPDYSEIEIERALGSEGYAVVSHDDVEEQVARLLAAGKIVARFNGRMEYGPRALGNRSILYQTTDKSVNDWLNKRLKRTEFMPFAPVTLKEYARLCYKNITGAESPARFMTITFDCTDWMKQQCPAVVHIDGTARPQLIDRDSNPSYYKILDEYRKITGLPSIVNTSFNMHEEPIVCSPRDAVRAFKESKLDYLAIGNYLVRNVSDALAEQTPTRAVVNAAV
ncbi:MAG TPA: carbamoyltransferase C-terminal domain-containing protein [Candidatus Binatia bacterium]